jgi:hypothetical protein
MRRGHVLVPLGTSAGWGRAGQAHSTNVRQRQPLPSCRRRNQPRQPRQPPTNDTCQH